MGTPSLMRRFLVVCALAALVAAACGDDDADDQPVVFGRGTIPSTVPSDFPVPANGVIGTTLVDQVNHRTEFSVQVAAEMVSVVQFFNIGLVNQGYVVDRSESLSQLSWEIDFSRGELHGTILVSAQGDLSQAIVTLNVA